jgi:hypothetical protein
MMQHLVGHLLNLAVGIATIGATVIFAVSLAVELTKRPRFSLRTLLIATTVLAILLGMAAATRG